MMELRLSKEWLMKNIEKEDKAIITAGYHLTEIPKGTLGQTSKIMEELLEVMDAEQQGNRIMVLVELSDLVGTIICYLEKNYPDMKLEDLLIMNEATVRAFRSGERT